MSSWRLTVDTKDDEKLVDKVFLCATGPFLYEDIRTVLLDHPQWQHINAHVKQKGLSYGTQQPLG